MNTQDTNRKLPMRVKLGYSVASVAPTIQMLIQMYFLLYFYVSIVGLSGGVAGTIILIARVWDFINDPLMGSLVEKSNKPGGTEQHPIC
ncbi:MFS transporter [Oscillospiraceae bacterium HCP3S3_D12]